MATRKKRSHVLSYPRFARGKEERLRYLAIKLASAATKAAAENAPDIWISYRDPRSAMVWLFGEPKLTADDLKLLSIACIELRARRPR